MIDLRSDTVTTPTAGMRHAMMEASVGDDVYGEDPTVNSLEAKAAAVTGKEAAIFATSGTQANLLALLTHCQRGEEYIAGQDAHTYRYEAGGGAVLGGIQPQPIPFNNRGELDLDQVRSVVKPNDFHFAVTRLICLENTQAGKPLSLDYLADFASLATELALGRHLDGARLFNAVVAQSVSAEEICSHFDSVSFCLSKGLGCPAGSMLVGDAAFIGRARRWRKMLGGGLRQTGFLAAAGLYALDNHVGRLAEDHINAHRLGEGLRQLGITLKEPVHTNMVMIDTAITDIAALRRFLETRDIRISGGRWVTHLDLSAEDVERVLEVVADYCG